jgi:hypothetical protein
MKNSMTLGSWFETSVRLAIETLLQQCQTYVKRGHEEIGLLPDRAFSGEAPPLTHQKAIESFKEPGISAVAGYRRFTGQVLLLGSRDASH